MAISVVEIFSTNQIQLIVKKVRCLLQQFSASTLKHDWFLYHGILHVVDINPFCRGDRGGGGGAIMPPSRFSVLISKI